MITQVTMVAKAHTTIETAIEAKLIPAILMYTFSKCQTAPTDILFSIMAYVFTGARAQPKMAVFQTKFSIDSIPSFVTFGHWKSSTAQCKKKQ